MSGEVAMQSVTYDQLVEKLERICFQLHVAEAHVREDNPTVANMLSDLAEETEGSLEKLCLFR